MLAAASAAGCGGDTEPQPAAVNCTQIGCSDGVLLSVRSQAAWLAGSYTLDLQLPGWSRSCSFQLPLAPATGGQPAAAALDCTPALELAVRAGTRCSDEAVASGLGPAGLCEELEGRYEVQGFITEPLSGELAVTLRRAGTTLAAARYPLEYRELFPNGPECAPECRQASVELVLPD